MKGLRALLGAFAVMAMLMSLAGPAMATGSNNPDKVWVCKYVGQPGDFETLKRGKQPIQVSASSVKPQPAAIGADFADGHFHSYVIDFVTKQNTNWRNRYKGSATCPTPTPTVEPTVAPTDEPDDVPTIQPSCTEEGESLIEVDGLAVGASIVIRAGEEIVRTIDENGAYNLNPGDYAFEYIPVDGDSVWGDFTVDECPVEATATPEATPTPVVTPTPAATPTPTPTPTACVNVNTASRDALIALYAPIALFDYSAEDMADQTIAGQPNWSSLEQLVDEVDGLGPNNVDEIQGNICAFAPLPTPTAPVTPAPTETPAATPTPAMTLPPTDTIGSTGSTGTSNGLWLALSALAGLAFGATFLFAPKRK